MAPRSLPRRHRDLAPTARIRPVDDRRGPAREQAARLPGTWPVDVCSLLLRTRMHVAMPERTVLVDHGVTRALDSSYLEALAHD